MHHIQYARDLQLVNSCQVLFVQFGLVQDYRTQYPLIALNEFRKMNNLVLKKLKDIKSPILIIHSKNDEVSIKDNVDIIQSEISSQNQEVLEVQYAHHNIFDTNKDTPIINEKILNFIKLYG